MKQEAETDPLRRVTRPRLYEEIAERLGSYIKRMDLKTGDRLPPERQLAERLGVSRASIRQATVALEVRGMLEVRQGNGTYLRRPDLLGESLSELVEKRRRLPEILEAREALECKLAALAAARHTKRDLRAIEVALKHMQEEIAQGGIGANGDAEFHKAITVAAKNEVLTRLMEQLSGAIHETRIESLSEPGRPPKSLAAHRRIAEAISRGDPHGAGHAMNEHLRVVADVRLMHWRPE